MFIRRNIIYLFIAMLCVLLCIKRSEAPFLGDYNAITAFLFQRPEENTYAGAVFFFIYELGLAFLASFLFYVLVDYFPKRRKERIAFILVADKLESIDVLIGKLFAFLMFLTETGTRFDQLTPEKAVNLCGIPLSNKDVYCHTKDILIATEEIMAEGDPDYFNQFFGPKSVSEKIMNQIDDIMALPYAPNQEDLLLRLLTSLKHNRMLCLLSSMNDSYIQTEGAGSYICNYFLSDVFELYTLFLQLRTFPYPKHLVIIEAVDPDSIKQAEETWARMKHDFPESVKLLENVSQKMKQEH